MLFVFDAEDKLNTEALEAKADDRKLEEFIRRNKRFILSSAYKTTHRFVTESDDEWSVALIAFHEAVQSYDVGKGNFKQFAALVIKRRLLDHLEKESRTRSEIPTDFSGGEQDDGEETAPVLLEARKKVREQAVRKSSEESALRDEIEAVAQVLGVYGVSFFDLAECSPKAQKTKAGCAAVVRALTADGEMMAQLRAAGTLPIKKLCESTGVPRKILENHRKYIIAAAEILCGDFPMLSEYLAYIKKGGE